MRPKDLRSASELAENKPHGMRIKYLGGCRCLPCKAANSRYSVECEKRQRQGFGNPLVSADDARRHLKKLSRAGVGYKTVADAAGVAASVVFKIRTGERTQIRRSTSEAILSVDKNCRADRSYVPAGPTWKRINWLLGEGFTKTELAKRLGYKTRAIQFRKDTITAASAVKVERFYNMIRGGE